MKEQILKELRQAEDAGTQSATQYAQSIYYRRHYLHNWTGHFELLQAPWNRKRHQRRLDFHDSDSLKRLAHWI